MSKSNSKRRDAATNAQEPGTTPLPGAPSAATDGDAQLALAVMNEVLCGLDNLDTLRDPVRHMLKEHTPPLQPRDVAWLAVNSVAWVLAPMVYSGLNRLVPAMQMRAFALGVLHLGGTAPEALQLAGYDLGRLSVGARKVARAELVRSDGNVPPLDPAELRAISRDPDTAVLQRAYFDASLWLVYLEEALRLRHRGDGRHARLAFCHEAMSRAFTLQAFETPAQQARSIVAALRDRGALRAGRDVPIDVLHDLWVALQSKPHHAPKVWHRKHSGRFGICGRAALDAVGVHSKSQHPLLREADVAERPDDPEEPLPFDRAMPRDVGDAAERQELRAVLLSGTADDVDRRDLALWMDGHVSCRERARMLGLSHTGLAKRETTMIGRIARHRPDVAKALKASLGGSRPRIAAR